MESDKNIISIDKKRKLRNPEDASDVTPTEALAEARRIIQIHKIEGFNRYSQFILKHNSALATEQADKQIDSELEEMLHLSKSIPYKALYAMLNPRKAHETIFLNPRYVAAAIECRNRLAPILSEENAIKFARDLYVELSNPNKLYDKFLMENRSFKGNILIAMKNEREQHEAELDFALAGHRDLEKIKSILIDFVSEISRRPKESGCMRKLVIAKRLIDTVDKMRTAR